MTSNFKNIYIVTSGDAASEIANLITNEINSNNWIIRGFIDDFFLKRNKSNKKNILNKFYRIYRISEIKNKKHSYAIVNTTNITKKKLLFDEIKKKFKIPILIHPKAEISDLAKIKKGSIIMSGAKIKFNSIIKENVFLNTNVIVGHDTVIGKNSFVGNSVIFNGNCRIGDNCLIGAGAIFYPGVKIGSNCKISMGSIVNEDLKSNTKLLTIGKSSITSNNEKK